MANSRHNYAFLAFFLVKQEESRIFIYNLLLFVCIGFGLALGRGSADALLFKRYGIEYLPIVYIFSAIVLSISCIFYSSFVDRLSSERFFKYLLGILASSLLIIGVLMRLVAPDWIYPIYYIIYEVASELLLIHAGLYLNQNLDPIQAKRLVPLIFGGLQIGVILGVTYHSPQERPL